MTIRLLCDWNGYPANSIVTLDAGTESGLVAAKLADTALTGGVAYVTPIPPSQKRISDAPGDLCVATLSRPVYDDASSQSPLMDHTAELQWAIDACPDRVRLVIPRGNWRFSSLVITKSIQIDWSGSSLLVDPTPVGVTTGNPAIWFKGALGTPRSIGNMTGIGSSVTLATPAQAAEFPAGQMVRVKDSKRVYCWADLDSSGTADATSSDAAGAVGYQDRWETNHVVSSDSNTGVIILARPTEWSYDASPTITPITPLRNCGTTNIYSIAEVDPGGVFSGPDIQAAPHLIKLDYCRDIYVADISATDYNLQAVNVDTCDGGIVERVRAQRPYRPGTGGHGYLGRVNRCTNVTFRECVGVSVRHVVDATQSYSSGSEHCLALNPANTAFPQHGLGERRCFSRFDRVFAPPDGAQASGWAIGNPSFAASYDAEITGPEYVGAGTAINIGYLSENTTVRNPRINGVVPTGSSANFIGVLVTTGAYNVKVLGGTIDGSQARSAGSRCIMARANVVTADAIAVKPDELLIDDVDVVGVFGDGTTAYAVQISECSSAVVQNSRFIGVANTSAGVALRADKTNNSLIIRGNHIRGIGAQAWKYGFQVAVAPTQLYRIENNTAQAAFSIADAYLNLASSSILQESNNAADVSVTLAYAATVSTDLAYNAAGGQPTQKTDFTVTLTGNATLGNPGGTPRNGRRYRWRIKQDATGSRTLAYQSKFKHPGGAPVLSTAANAVDILEAVYSLADDVYYCNPLVKQLS